VSDYSPVGAREHVSQAGPRAVVRPAGGDPDALFAADDAAPTRPIPIIAERRLADTGLSVFPFALGTGKLATVDEGVAERILHRFAVRGGELYDVTDDDGSGRSQELVGMWRAGRPADGALTMLTPSLERDGGGAIGPRRVTRAVEAALARLRCERIDLLMLDLRGNAAQGLGMSELLGAAEELVATGTVRHVGASAGSGAELLEARVLAGDGLPRIVATRLGWSVTDKAAAAEEIRMVAAAQQIALLPDATATSLALASPSLAPKVLAGWAQGGRRPQAMTARLTRPERDRAADALGGRGREHRIAVALDRVSAELGVAPGTTQLAWLLAKRGVVAPIVRVRRPEQVDLLMDAAGVRLTRAQMLELGRAVETPR
jgi:aryl-alcohol dehydrogenase-like predicted oxidoreductase